MPLNPPISPSENLPRGILLVEEYNALGVAISSALRKFAPLHGIEVAQSFEEATAIAARMKPELFVLDLDPPPSGEIAFFNQLKADHPGARVLVIAAGTSRELRAERGTSGALQFIEKPFDLAEFGAAVQALVGPWTEPAGSVRGTLRDLSTIDIVQMKCLALSTAIVGLRTADGTSGDIHFQKGQIIHAATGMLSGLPALEEIVGWTNGEFSEEELPNPRRTTIDVPWPALLLDLIRKREERTKKQAPRHKPARGPSNPNPKTGRKILVIDDTEMLLIFVADVLATADQEFQIMTAATGVEGIRLATSEKPDLVLLDYSLSDTTGDKVCRALLENEQTARIPILMMSGHVTELARTAADFANVVAALPKPFLSGALINAVEKALAAGPLPKAAVKSDQPVMPPSAAPETMPSTEKPVTPLSNGDGRGGEGNAPQVSTAAARVAPAPERASVISDPSVEPQPPQPWGPLPGRLAAPSLVRQTGLQVTFALDVVALQLTSLLRTDLMRLQPASHLVAVEMERPEGQKQLALETGFRLGRIELGSDGTIDSIHIIPTGGPIQLPAGAGSFTIGDLSFEPAEHQLQLTGTRHQLMGVQLTAPFEMGEVELSADFKVATIRLLARGKEVVVRNHAAEEGAPFEVQKVELDSAAELRTIFVRPRSEA